MSSQLSVAELGRIRRQRIDPRPTQFDYLHLKVLRDDIAGALGGIAEAPEVLDVFCGTRPYDGLLPAGSDVTGLDVTGSFGAADVVTDEFLPFAEASFDLVVCFEAFHFVEDPVAALAEIERVLRPGGLVLITVPLTWEYERDSFEHRFTGPVLERLLAGWEEVEVRENGGRGVAWATQTGRIIDLARYGIRRRIGGAALVLEPVFGAAFLLVNAVGSMFERALARSSTTLPMNLMARARRP